MCIWRSGRDDLIGVVAVNIWRGGCVDSFAWCLEDKLVRQTVISSSDVLRFLRRCMVEAISAPPVVYPRSLYLAWVVGGHIGASYCLLPSSFGAIDVIVRCCCPFCRPFSVAPPDVFDLWNVFVRW